MRRSLLTSALLLSLTACGSNYGIIREAPNNPLAGKTQFSIAPLDFKSAMINDKPVAAWVAEGGSDEAKDWPQNTANSNSEFVKQLMDDRGTFELNTQGPPPSTGIVVVPTVEQIETGIYAVAFARPTHVRVHVRVYADGKLADELVMNSTVQANIYRPSFNQRMADCMQDVAKDVIGYLNDRSKAATK